MNKLIKKFFLVLSFIFINIFLVSCTGEEIDSLGIVIAIGFDIEDGEIVITNEVTNPRAASSLGETNGEEATLFVISRGKTVEEAVMSASLTFDRRLYYQHAHVIIIGEEIAKQGISNYIDMLSRNNEIRENTFLLIAKDSKAYEVMGTNTALSKSAGRYIYEVINQNKLNSKSRPLEINKFFKYLYTKEEGYVMGLVEKIEKPLIDSQGKTVISEVLSLEGGAFFKDEKLKGYFNGEEMMGFNFIVDEFKSGVIVFGVPEKFIAEKYKPSDKPQNYSSFQILKSKTKLDIELKDENLHLTVGVKLRGNLKSVQEGVDLQNKDVLKGMEKQIGNKIEYYINNTLKKAQQEFEGDTFSIGEVVHRKYPELWKKIENEWEDVFKDLEYTINVDASINEVGFTNSPSSVRKERYE